MKCTKPLQFNVVTFCISLFSILSDVTDVPSSITYYFPGWCCLLSSNASQGNRFIYQNIPQRDFPSLYTSVTFSCSHRRARIKNSTIAKRQNRALQMHKCVKHGVAGSYFIACLYAGRELAVITRFFPSRFANGGCTTATLHFVCCGCAFVSISWIMHASDDGVCRQF